MCFQALTMTPETCQTDLVVYKIVEHTYRIKGLRQFVSFLYTTKKVLYTLGETVTEKEFTLDLRKGTEWDWGRTKRGLYAYRNYHDAKQQLDGFRRFGFNRTVIVKCIIPAGTRFYQNRRLRTDGWDERRAELICAETLKVVAYNKRGEWIERDSRQAVP